jgi:hypothetical protein
MLPREGSPLLRIPNALDRRQLLYLDGIRYAIAMADLAYRRLYDVLLAESHRFAREEAAPAGQSGQTITSVLLDAWMMVDSVNRLRQLLDEMPGLKKKQTPLLAFRAATNVVPDLRNAVQHLRGEFSKLVAANQPVWGAVTWLSVLAGTPTILRWCTVYGGTVYENWAGPAVRPFHEPIAIPIDHITLHAHSLSVSLTTCYTALADLTAFLETMVEQSFARKLPVGAPTHAADIIFCMEFSQGPPTPGPAPVPESKAGETKS